MSTTNIIPLGTPHLCKIIELLAVREHLVGDIVELGVYAGVMTRELAKLGRHVWAFDTFTGIPRKDFTPDLDLDEPGKFAPPERIYQELLYTPHVTPMKGRFIETLPIFRHPSEFPIVLAYIDCDLYLSAKQALVWLQTYLIPGGCIVFDDHTYPGIQRAIRETLLPTWQYNGGEVLYAQPSNQDQCAKAHGEP